MYLLIMGFWKNVKQELDYTGATRKDLAFETGISVQTINRAIERDSRPYLEDALKVARFFKKEVTYFIDSSLLLKSEQNTSVIKKIEDDKANLALYRKYHSLISYCEMLPSSKSDALQQLAQSLAEDEAGYSSGQ